MADKGQAEACALVWERFPALKGSRPIVQQMGARRVYVFSTGVGGGPGGRALQQVVRVTVGPDGAILKVTASR